MDEEIHDIFVVNPIEQVGFTQKNVKITLTNSETLQGVVYTIDPVSQSVVLISMNESQIPTVKVVMKDSIKSMEKISEMDVEQKLYFDKMFTLEKKELCYDDQKKKVKNWLEKNLIPVTEYNDILKIDNLEIHPPYGPDQCYSGNSIVLSRIHTLLGKMPSDDV